MQSDFGGVTDWYQEPRNRTNQENLGRSGRNPGNTRGNVAQAVHGCSYKTFLNCQPHKFNGTEGVVGLSRWYEKMESVFEISKCAEEDKVKFVACTLEWRALTWWNGNKMEQELKKIKWYIRGLPERVKANVTSSKPVNLHEAINMARELVEQAIQAKATRIGESNKRKWENHQKNNNNRHINTHHHQHYRRQEVVIAYAPPADGRGYTRNLPLGNQCKLHHIGQCLVKCRKCKKLGHQTKDC
ncbi:putative reverse transcriptase domain-containing protein [Tanacetum coccineum]